LGFATANKTTLKPLDGFFLKNLINHQFSLIFRYPFADQIELFMKDWNQKFY